VARRAKFQENKAFAKTLSNIFLDKVGCTNIIMDYWSYQ
jgi:hypothetical protein